MVSGLLDSIVSLVIGALNAMISGFGAAASSTIGLLPDMPAIPSPPTWVVNVEGWVAWAFPVGTVVTLLDLTTTLYLVWLVVGLVLRWAKFNRGNA